MCCLRKSSVTAFACKEPHLQSKTSSSALLLTFTTHTQHEKREASDRRIEFIGAMFFFTSKKLLMSHVASIQHWRVLCSIPYYPTIGIMQFKRARRMGFKRPPLRTMSKISRYALIDSFPFLSAIVFGRQTVIVMWRLGRNSRYSHPSLKSCRDRQKLSDYDLFSNVSELQSALCWHDFTFQTLLFLLWVFETILVLRLV